jgi:hypothetical protein
MCFPLPGRFIAVVVVLNVNEFIHADCRLHLEAHDRNTLVTQSYTTSVTEVGEY